MKQEYKKTFKTLLTVFIGLNILVGCSSKPEKNETVQEVGYEVISKDVPQFDEVPIAAYDQGYVVKVDNHYGFIDPEGNYKIDPDYEVITRGINEYINDGYFYCGFETLKDSPSLDGGKNFGYLLGVDGVDNESCGNSGFGGTTSFIYTYDGKNVQSEKTSEYADLSEVDKTPNRTVAINASDYTLFEKYYIYVPETNEGFGPYKKEEVPMQEENNQQNPPQNQILTNNQNAPQQNSQPAPQQPQEPQIQTFQLGDSTHPVNPDDEEIEYIGERIRALENLEKCTKLKKLLLRRNVIKKIENISHLTQLVELELYDNQLKKIEGLDTLVNLDTLDLSYNLIKKVEGLENLKNLRVLFLVENHISKIEGVDMLPKLYDLDFGSNKIKQIENLDNLAPHLVRLSLAKNRIRYITNLSALTNLTFLTLQANKLDKIQGLDTLVNLKELYLSQNFIEKIENLEKLVKLEILDLAFNKISKLENIEKLTELTDLWLNNNNISNPHDLEILKYVPKVTTVYFWKNPIASVPSYKQIIQEYLKDIEQIDSTVIKSNY